MQLLIFCIASCFAVASASTCPDLPVVQDFDLSQYAGTWYQQAATSFKHFPGACAKTVYTLDTDTNLLNFTNSVEVLFKTITLKINGYAALDNATSLEGKLRVHVRTPVGKDSAEYWVLATDYDSYTVIYSCRKILFHAAGSAWVLTRDKIPSDETNQLIEVALEDIEQNGGPSASDFSATSQKGC